MKKIVQCLLVLFLFVSTTSSFGENIKVSGFVPKPASGGGIPKTGVTTQCTGDPYNGSYAYPDDGYYQMGNPVTPRFTAGTGAATGTVTDNVTGLMWEQKTTDGTIHDTNNTYNWSDAFDVFLKGLNDANFAGNNDWRIPNIIELQSILDYGYGAPGVLAINPIFTNTSSTYSYWSSTTAVAGGYTTYAWTISFSNEFMGTCIKTGLIYVRAVRGGSGGLH